MTRAPDAEAGVVSAPCPSREGHYVPWSFGEVFTCAQCGGRVRQSHTIPALRGSGYAAVYPIPEHEAPAQYPPVSASTPDAGGGSVVLAGGAPRQGGADNGGAA